MSTFRTTVEQVSGLAEVAQALESKRIASGIFIRPGDVVALTVGNVGAEVVFAIDGFDIWEDGPVMTDLTATAAAAEMLRRLIDKNRRKQ